MSRIVRSTVFCVFVLASLVLPCTARAQSFFLPHRFYEMFRYTHFGLKGTYDVSVTNVVDSLDYDNDTDDYSNEASFRKHAIVAMRQEKMYFTHKNVFQITFDHSSKIAEFQEKDSKYSYHCRYYYDNKGTLSNISAYQRDTLKDSISFTNTYRDGLLISQKINLIKYCIDMVSVYDRNIRMNGFTHDCPELKPHTGPRKKAFGDIFAPGGYQFILASYYIVNDFETVVYDFRKNVVRTTCETLEIYGGEVIQKDFLYKRNSLTKCEIKTTKFKSGELLDAEVIEYQPLKGGIKLILHLSNGAEYEIELMKVK